VVEKRPSRKAENDQSEERNDSLNVQTKRNSHEAMLGDNSCSDSSKGTWKRRIRETKNNGAGGPGVDAWSIRRAHLANVPIPNLNKKARPAQE